MKQAETDTQNNTVRQKKSKIQKREKRKRVY